MDTRPNLPQEQILPHFYAALEASRQFTYAHHGTNAHTAPPPDPAAAGAALDQSRADAAEALLAYPASLTLYRRYLHQFLAADEAFQARLSQRNISQDRYFRDVEKIIRCGFHEHLLRHDLSRQVTSRDLLDAAEEQSRGFAASYLSQASVPAIAARLVGCDPHDPAQAARMQNIRACCWATHLAFAYASAFLGAEVHPARLAQSGDAGQIITVFEAGYHFSHHMTERLMPYLANYGVSETTIRAILLDAMVAIAEAQRQAGVAAASDAITAIRLLTQHAIDTYEQETLYNLLEQCNAARVRQDALNAQMQQYLAHMHFGSVEDEDKRIRDKNAERQAAPEARAPDREKEVIDAGITIIEFLKSLQMTGKAEEQGIAQNQQSGEVAADGSSSDDSGHAGNKRTRANYEIQHMEFEVKVGETTKRMKLTQIMSVLRRGQSVQFSSKSQARSFVKGASQVARSNGEDEGFELSQVKFSQKGKVKDLGGEIEFRDRLHEKSHGQHHGEDHSHDMEKAGRIAHKQALKVEAVQHQHELEVKAHHKAEAQHHAEHAHGKDEHGHHKGDKGEKTISAADLGDKKPLFGFSSKSASQRQRSTQQQKSAQQKQQHKLDILSEVDEIKAQKTPKNEAHDKEKDKGQHR